VLSIIKLGLGIIINNLQVLRAPYFFRSLGFPKMIKDYHSFMNFISSFLFVFFFIAIIMYPSV